MVLSATVYVAYMIALQVYHSHVGKYKTILSRSTTSSLAFSCILLFVYFLWLFVPVYSVRIPSTIMQKGGASETPTFVIGRTGERRFAHILRTWIVITSALVSSIKGLNMEISDYKKAIILKEYAHAFLTSKVMFAACDLKLFDVLAESEKPLSAEAVAERLGTSNRGTECLLSACVGLKFLDVDIQNGAAFYKNTELAQSFLTTTSSKSLCNTIRFFSDEVYPAASHLIDAIRLGNPVCHDKSGVRPNEFFKDLYRSEETKLLFMKYMDSSWISFAKKETISAFDLSFFKTICDLGGCSGTLAKYCASLFPSSSIILYDLPEIIQTAKEHFILPEDNRIILQQGNFFLDPLPNADLFILSRILFDWDDVTCLKLLHRIYMACNSGGGVLVIETILNEHRHGSLLTHIENIPILLLTEGKVRTASEYKRMLETVGFKDIKFNIKGNLFEGIFARK